MQRLKDTVPTQGAGGGSTEKNHPRQQEPRESPGAGGLEMGSGGLACVLTFVRVGP